MDVLKEQRRVRRAAATRKCNGVDSQLASLNIPELNQNVAYLNSLLEELKELDSQIFIEMCSDNDVTDDMRDDEYEECQKYVIKIMSVVTAMETRIRNNQASVSHPPVNPMANNSRSSRFNLPQIPLPTFSNSATEDLPSFFKNFEDIIDKFQLSDSEKFWYLKEQLTGDAQTVIQGLAKANLTYQAAKELLTKAFACETTQKFKAISSLQRLKFKPGDDPYKFISEYKLLIESCRTLNVDLDCILQYHIWSAMNQEMQSHLVHICNANKPTLGDIEEHIYEATERYLASSKVTKHLPNKNTAFSESTANAAALQYKPKSQYCSLCSTKDKRNESHSTFTCTKFPDAKAKLDKIKISNGCEKCASLQHITKACKHRFNRKCYCGEWHYSFLCTNKKSERSDLSSKAGFKANSKQMGANSVHTNDGNSLTMETGAVFVGGIKIDRYGNDAIIPSFTSELPDGGILRCMYDTGCQCNFIENSLATKLGLKVVQKNFPLKVNGFVSSESSTYDVVEVPISEKHPPILAICVPKIKTVLQVPGLGKAVSMFLEKGYTLADKFLPLCKDDRIENFDFILGINDSHILPMKDIIFGHNTPSVYSETPYGVCLMGSIGRMLSNSPYLQLHDASSVKQVFKDVKHKPKKNKSTDNSSKFSKSSKNQSKEKNHIGQNEANSLATSLQMENFEKSFELSSFHIAVEPSGYISDAVLDNATNEVLRCTNWPNMSYDNEIYNDKSRDIDDELNKFVLDTTYRNENGSLVMPLLWNQKVEHLLGRNENLSKRVLASNLKRLEKEPEKLKMYDDVIKTQLKDGIIEKIENLPEFLASHPNASFLAHTGIFKPDRETTKCRIVMLSNLVQNTAKNSKSISHNSAMLSGACLNRKISTALTKIRFGKHFYCMDIKRAFNSIKLRDIDQEKLMFHFFKDVQNKDFSLVGYKFLALPFGLKCSPNLMLLALYKVLILDSDESDVHHDIKKSIYDKCYMDNLFHVSDSDPISNIADIVREIFEPYNMFLQQFYTNIPELQEKLDNEFDQNTEQKIKVLGMEYDRLEDSLTSVKLKLDGSANTMRKVLSSFASNFDVLQINAPLLNRARLFAHKLQCSKIGWDERLDDQKLKEWSLICRQVNSSPGLSIPRMVGGATSRLALLCFGDASRELIGCTVYMRNEDTGKVSFIQSRTKIIGQSLIGKSIPQLELHALSLAVSTMVDIYNELTGSSSVNPLNIEKLYCFSDSMCALNWLNNYVNKLEKMHKQSSFVMNRLAAIEKLCINNPIEFGFISGQSNPSDLTTRVVSYKILTESCYVNGPAFISGQNFNIYDNMFAFRVPNPLAIHDQTDVNPEISSSLENNFNEAIVCNLVRITDPIIPLDKYSSLSVLLRKVSSLITCVKKWKNKIKGKQSDRGNRPDLSQTQDTEVSALDHLIISSQGKYFAEIHDYFDNPTVKSKIPILITQLNVFRDEDGILRVRTKFKDWKANPSKKFPILIAKQSELAKLIVKNLHCSMSHAGTYTLLAELRGQYYIPNIFTVVKSSLKSCAYCTRMHGRTIKLNQSPYRSFRSEPPAIPFRHIMIDHFGPYKIKIHSKVQKVWILCITCLWSRSINLKISYDMSLKEFLRNLQLHILEYGMAEYIYSDSGVAMKSGGNVIMDFFKGHEAKKFFDDHGMMPPEFIQYPKGNHELGSLVETTVKLCRKLIGSSIRTYILDWLDFEVVIAQAIHCVNKRPIAFKNSLRDCSVTQEVPEPITPELLIKGYSTVSVNIIPEKDREQWEANKSEKICDHYEKLTIVRNNIKNAYHKEFLGTLLNQSTDKKYRYTPVSHKKLKVGDVVLLKEDLTKAINYPMGIVLKINENSLGETTDVEIRKGCNREIVRRHVSSLIPFHSSENDNTEKLEDVIHERQNQAKSTKPARKAAQVSQQKTKIMLNN